RPAGDGAVRPSDRAQLREGDRAWDAGGDRQGPGSDRRLPRREPVSGPLLEVRYLRVAYGHVEAVRGISLSVSAGEIVALIGPNGAGKSSTLNAIAGLVRPARGTVRLEAKDPAGAPSHEAVAAGTVLVPGAGRILKRMPAAGTLITGSEAAACPGGREEA